MNPYPSAKELAREAREILESDTETPEEHFEALVQEGIIDRNGRVICAKLFGEAAAQATPALQEKNGPYCMNPFPSAKELAREALEILESETMTPEEHFEALVQEGIIDRNGRVICAKLFGEAAAQATPAVPEPNGQ